MRHTAAGRQARGGTCAGGQRRSSGEKPPDRRKNIAAAKANKSDLAPAEKCALTGRAAADIAHEIRNALTNIVLSLLEIRKDDLMKPEGLRYAEIMERNSKKIEYSVTRLLECAPPIEADLQPYHEEDVVRRIGKVRVKRVKPGQYKGKTVG